MSNRLTPEILSSMGFERTVELADGEELKRWHSPVLDLHEDSWWITELDEDGEPLAEPKNAYVNDLENQPEVTFTFATVVRGTGEMKAGWLIATDTQLCDLMAALTAALTGKNFDSKSKQVAVVERTDKLCRMNQNFVCNCADDSRCPNF